MASGPTSWASIVYGWSGSQFAELMAGLAFCIIAFILQFITMTVAAMKLYGDPAVSSGPRLAFPLATLSAVCLTLGVTMATDVCYRSAIAVDFAVPAAGPGFILLLVALGIEYAHIWTLALSTPPLKGGGAAGAAGAAAAPGAAGNAFRVAPLTSAELAALPHVQAASSMQTGAKFANSMRNLGPMDLI